MSQPQDSVPDEASFEGLVDLGSIPPAAGEPAASGGSDVHAARTTVARVSESFLDELKRGRAEAAAFQNEAPTKPKGLVVLATSTVPPAPELPLGPLEVTIDIADLPPAPPPSTVAARAPSPPVPAPLVHAAPIVAPRPAPARLSLVAAARRRLASIDVRRVAFVLAAASLVAASAVAALFYWAGRM